MLELVSPGSIATVIDESMYTQAQETCVPLIILATAAEKQHPFTSTSFAADAANGAACIGCAIGTYENSVVRTVTSIRQSLELYGTPRFLKTADGRSLHGDARNEYGLLALNHFLAQGRRAFVVRANINLNDDINDVAALWQKKIDDSSDMLEELIAEYVRNFNESRQLVPLNPTYKTSVTADELKTLARQALNKRAFNESSFANVAFQNDFLRDHGVPTSGYVEVLLDDSRGYVTSQDVTGLDPDEDYQVRIGVNGYGIDGQPFDTSTASIIVSGANARNYAGLINELNDALSVATFSVPTSSAPTSSTPGPQVVASLVNGRIRFTSTLVGTTSEVAISNEGLLAPLFITSNLDDVVEFGEPVQGAGNAALRVYTDYTYTALSVVDGEFDGLDAAIDEAAMLTPTFDIDRAIAVLKSASLEYQHTREFRTYTSLGANDAERRASIAKALIAVVKQNPYIRNELYEHNIVLCPGYPEVGTALDEFIKSREIKEEVFAIGSVPMNVAPDGPGGLTEWNASNGIKNANFAYYYPHPMVRNVDGELVLGDSSMVALRALAYNDYVAEPWFAPAGVRRGQATGVADVGYVTGELGLPTDFVQVHLQEGHRDSLYTSNINPIAFFESAGIVVYGQKTTQSFASAMDRVAVSRMVKYIQRGLRKGSLPFVFEQNDYVTREQLRAMADNFLNIIMMRRGLYDYATICDLSNNTDERIERNEMWLDVAIKPTKQAEFIYVPIRVVKTSADIGTGRTVSLGRR